MGSFHERLKMSMKQVYMTRKDTDVGIGEFDSIAWLFEARSKRNK
jgi:hypothetical protein